MSTSEGYDADGLAALGGLASDRLRTVHESRGIRMRRSV